MWHSRGCRYHNQKRKIAGIFGCILRLPLDPVAALFQTSLRSTAEAAPA